MQAVVHVTLKKTVLDPQGRAICSTLQGLDYNDVVDIRQGKFFEIEFADGRRRDEVEKEVEKIAREVLANPVIEEFRVELTE